MPVGSISIQGRIQKPHSRPALWLEKYDIALNEVWQYLDVEEYRKRYNLDISALILELQVEQVGFDAYQRKWREYDDTWINRHKAYALQWFSMAAAFILMCLVLEFRSRREH